MLKKTFSSIFMLLFMFTIITAVIKNLWSYLVPKLFPGAVEQNLIVSEISWKTSIILVLILFLMK